jgi:MFS family permease
MTEKMTDLKTLFTKELIAIMLISATGFFSQELLSPVLSLYMRDAGLTDQNIGTTFSVMMIGIALSEVFWGWAVDRISLKIVLFLGGVVYGVATTALLIPQSLTLFLVVMFFYGFSRSPIYIVGRWYMGVHAPEDIKAQAFAILMVMISVTQSIAAFSSGFFVEAWGFQSTIWISAAIPFFAGLMVIVVGRWLHFNKPTPAQVVSEQDVHESRSTMGRARLITVFLGSFGMLFFVSWGVLVAYLPLLASDVVHLAPSQIGILFGLRGIVRTLSILPMSRLADKVGKSVFIPLGITVVILSMILVALSSDFTMLFIAVFIFAIAASMYFPSVTAILSASVPVTWVGTSMGIYGFLEDVGWMIGPAAGGLLLNYWAIQSPFVFGAIVASLGMPLYFWGKRRGLL